MKGLTKYLDYFPRRIRSALLTYNGWDSVCEIRLRRGLPLSLTDYQGNVIINEKGKVCPVEKALCATEEEIREFVAAFCKGSVYRYFDTLTEGFLVDDFGYRLGVCSDQSTGNLLPKSFSGVNLRIPRQIEGASLPLLEHFRSRPLASTLVISKPGAGKTTLIRDLAERLSRGKTGVLYRVSVIDERREIFPQAFASGAGLCDLISGKEKGKGIELALRLYAPEIILCDEIGSDAEADALLRCGNGGCLVFATVHGDSLSDVARRPAMGRLLREGLFSYTATLKRIPDTRFRSEILLEKVL